jgi:hypothetical protein
MDAVAQVLETLLRIRRQDPLIYQKDVRFFPEEEGQGQEGEGDEEGAGKTKSKQQRDDKPMYLRTVLAQQVGAVSCVGMAVAQQHCDASARGFKPAAGMCTVLLLLLQGDCVAYATIQNMPSCCCRCC